MTRKPFNFRLERVRALRERFEDVAKEELAASLSERLEGEAQLRAAEDVHAGAMSARRAAHEATGRDLVALQAYLEQVERRRQAAAIDLDRREADVDARRSALRAAARERQVLERLKQRRLDDHWRELARRDGALLDEMAVARHGRAETAL